jgi:hypothetical protein
VQYVSLLGVVVIGFLVWYRWREAARARALADYRFPPVLARKLRATYPHLDDAQARLVLEGLREFFALAQMARGRLVAMPSQAVDVAWHEFILHTRAYQQFCRVALGRFLHHTPATAMASPTMAQDGIKRAWRLSCAREKINPKAPLALPLLFGLDAALAIPDGFRYSLDCSAALAAGAAPGDTYCAAHIGCGGGCAGSSGGDSDGGGDGDGGGGCGGGGD